MHGFNKSYSFKQRKTHKLSAEAPHIKAFKLPTLHASRFFSQVPLFYSVDHLRCFHLISSKKPLRRDSLLFWRGRQEPKSCDQSSTCLNYDLACRWPFQGQPMRYELYRLHNNPRLQEYAHISSSPRETDVTGLRRRERLLNLVTRHYTWCVILHLILLPSYDLFLLGHFFITSFFTERVKKCRYQRGGRRVLFTSNCCAITPK